MRFDVKSKLFVEENTNANKIAFVAADTSLTWQELKILSDKICNAFKKINIPAGYPVLVYGNKEAFFLAAILSCYRMDLAFVILSPALPQKRIEKIIEQTKSEILINCGNYTDIPKTTVLIDKNLTPTSNLSSKEIKGESDCYILFTSGSSGEPKGVKISDANIIAFTKWFGANFGVDEKTVFINQADFSFDISLADFFGALHTGGTAIFNTSELSIKTGQFFERINKYKGTYWNSTPSFLGLCLSDKNFNAATLPSIEKFVLSGENLSPQLVRNLKTRFPTAKVINAYGPTETTIFAGFAEITDELLSETLLPICKTNNSMVSLKEDEIIISGETVGLGYLNNEGLTQERFINRSFHTGDLAFEKNGYIYFNGRKDEQIKFNGYRIELNEIKHVLEKIDFIVQAECIPIIIDKKIKRLVAFVKIKIEPADISSIQSILKTELPNYMVPSEIVVVKDFPLTASAKIDRQKLLQNYLSA